MHATPADLDAIEFSGGLLLYSGDHTSAIRRPSRGWFDPREVLSEWNSFALVRNPYIRVLSAFEQRTFGEYDAWACNTKRTSGKKPSASLMFNDPACSPPPPKTFPAFMRWLARGLAVRTLAWCCVPSIVHFRPATDYTHHVRHSLNPASAAVACATIPAR